MEIPVSFLDVDNSEEVFRDNADEEFLFNLFPRILICTKKTLE